MTASHRLELELPSDIFAKLERAAEQRHRSVQDEAVDLLRKVVPEDDQLPPKTRAALTHLATLDDADLLKAARKRPSTRSLGLWRKLLAKRQSDELSANEEQILDEIEESFHRVTLIRAEAALLLQDRGYNIAHVDSPP